MTPRCARCWDWTPDSDETLAEHAEQAGHPLCVSCDRSLPVDEPQVCQRCQERAGELLTGIAMMYTELPRHLARPTSSALGGTRTSSDGRPLPGGDVLVLLGGGSEGLADDGVTAVDGDAPSVWFDLDYWSRAWAELRGEPRPPHAGAIRRQRPRSLSSEVRSALRYLEVYARWAATSFPGWAAYLTDLRELHARLEQATSRSRRPERMGADCFDCGEALVRRVDRASGLLEESISCIGCAATYTYGEYLLAQHAAADAASRVVIDGTTWATPARLSTDLGRPERTIRWWHHRGYVSSHTRGGVLLLAAAEVEARHHAGAAS